MSEAADIASLTPNVDLARLGSLFDLSGKSAFVPGGYGAIGEAVCWALAMHGARVAVAGPREDKAAALAEAISGSGHEAAGYLLDARRVPDIRVTVDEVAERFGGIDILVNCVGIQREESILDVTEETFDDMYETNLKSAMFLGQAVAKQQIARGRGGRHVHLLSVRSQLALRGRGYSAYCSTKGGLLMLLKQHAMELAPHGITVNGVAPTFIQSDRIRPHLEKPEFRDFILDRNPLGRIGDPVEVAGPVIALVADAGSYMTGQVVYVDGGVTASQ
ncbi:SDR family NAD(P)-dependent oxidoreductase [Nisaea sediminum]|uniref:SDR family NAD(P)-dependent oxidoreductase n=1 Tax=Nisaea sediminum TaxID=2775867 RepID=UPI001866597C|nr:SDR family oxidoreductase [Nisaea sediminum]